MIRLPAARRPLLLQRIRSGAHAGPLSSGPPDAAPRCPLHGGGAGCGARSVTWKETTVPFEKRMDKYRKYQFLPQHLEARPLPRAPHPRELLFDGDPPLHCLHCTQRQRNSSFHSRCHCSFMMRHR